MTKKKKTRSIVVILVLVILFITLLIYNGIIVFDYSAERRGMGVYWKDTLYVPCSGEYTEGRTIARTNDGFMINEVKEDKTHTFIVMRSFLDQYFL